MCIRIQFFYFQDFFCDAEDQVADMDDQDATGQEVRTWLFNTLFSETCPHLDISSK